jgi:hypothetical protein
LREKKFYKEAWVTQRLKVREDLSVSEGCFAIGGGFVLNE